MHTDTNAHEEPAAIPAGIADMFVHGAEQRRSTFRGKRFVLLQHSKQSACIQTQSQISSQKDCTWAKSYTTCFDRSADILPFLPLFYILYSLSRVCRTSSAWVRNWDHEGPCILWWRHQNESLSRTPLQSWISAASLVDAEDQPPPRPPLWLPLEYEIAWSSPRSWN